METLRELDLESRPLVTEYLRRFPPQVSELTFTNLFVWRRAHPVGYAEDGGALLFVAREDKPSPGLYLLGSPVGEGVFPPDRLAGIPDLCGCLRADESFARALEAAGWTLRADDDNSDYVYRVADLAGLKGERYHKKRNLVKQCLEAYECRYEPITPALIPECLAMQDEWCRVRQCGMNPGLCNENEAIRQAFAHFEALELIGGAIRVNGRISAFALAEELSPGTAVWHFEKALPEIHGLGQLINQWFSANALSAFEFVNREQDLGLPGLRQAKESYDPDHRVRKFIALAPGGEAAAGAAGLADPHECDRHGVPAAAG